MTRTVIKEKWQITMLSLVIGLWGSRRASKAFLFENTARPIVRWFIIALGEGSLVVECNCRRSTRRVYMIKNDFY